MNDTLNLIRQLLEKDRSIRRFDESRPVSPGQLLQLIDLTRYCASGRNLQPLKYRLVATPEECSRVFPLLAWAAYLSEWPGPEVGERPTAYLVQSLDTRLTQSCLCDDGLQLQAITLGATALGLGGCIIKSFNLTALRQTLALPDWATPLYVLALGYPKETVRLTGVENGNIKYSRNPEGVHFVPKRQLEDLIIEPNSI